MNMHALTDMAITLMHAIHGEVPSARTDATRAHDGLCDGGAGESSAPVPPLVSLGYLPRPADEYAKVESLLP